MRLRIPRFGRPGGRLLRSVGGSAVALVAAFLFTQWWDFTVPALGRAEYQAVFLTNGQTYFGRYYDRIGAYAKLEDVYYLQQVQGADDSKAPETKIVRRGSELHGPPPRMLLPKSAVLFVEDLAEASAIARYMRQDRR